MNPVYVTYASGVTGAQAAIIIDQAVAPFTMNVGCYIVSGAVTYGLQYTLDDPNLGDPNDVAVRWFNDATIPSGSTTSLVSGYAHPVRAVRVNIASSTGPLELKVVQGYSIT